MMRFVFTMLIQSGTGLGVRVEYIKESTIQNYIDQLNERHYQGLADSIKYLDSVLCKIVTCKKNAL